jgi:hypothetical protein
MINVDAVIQSIVYVLLGAALFFLGTVTGGTISESGGPSTAKATLIESPAPKAAK